MVTDRALNTTPLQPVSQVPVRPVTPGHAHPTPRQAVHGGQCSQDTRPAVRPSGLHSGVKCLSESWTDTSQSRTEGQLTAARCVLQVSGSPYHTHTHTPSQRGHREVIQTHARPCHITAGYHLHWLGTSFTALHSRQQSISSEPRPVSDHCTPLSVCLAVPWVVYYYYYYYTSISWQVRLHRPPLTVY